MKKTYITAEMLDGTIHGPERILFPDKLGFERSAKANGWALSDEFRAQSFLSWAALKRVGAISDTYEDFLAALADIAFDTDEDEDDPTTPDGDDS